MRGACAELRSLSRSLKTIGGLRGACAELSALSRTFAVVLVAVWDARRLRRAKVVCPPRNCAGSLSRWWVARRLRRAFPVGSLSSVVAELRGACAELRSLLGCSLCVRPFVTKIYVFLTPKCICVFFKSIRWKERPETTL